MERPPQLGRGGQSFQAFGVVFTPPLIIGEQN